VFTVGYLAAILVMRANGTGFSGKELKLDQMTALLKTTLSIEVIYYLCVNAIKVSIVFFYMRIGKALSSQGPRTCMLTSSSIRGKNV
jgi:hypothetical protein